MSLPKIAKVTHELVIPSTGKKIKFRPFLVKEEKILILAQESNSPAQITDAVKKVITACVQTRGFRIEELATFDIEYIFINIRSRSIGEIVEISITCEDDGVTEVKTEVCLDEVEIFTDEKHSKKIKLNDEYSLLMKYPTMDSTDDIDGEEPTVEQSFELIAKCIDQIYSEDESQSGSDYKLEELVAWLGELEPKVFVKIEEFFVTMPKLRHSIKVINPKTGVINEIVLEGLESFFA